MDGVFTADPRRESSATLIPFDNVTEPDMFIKFRVNGVVSNMPEFREAFSCETGQPMAPENMCRVW